MENGRACGFGRTQQYRHHMRLSLIPHWLTWRKAALLLVISFWLPVFAIFGSDAWIRRSSRHCHTTVETVPFTPVALVLGCSPKIGGSPNLFFKFRIDAAVALHRAGRVKAFIVSGDNGTKDYDEPTVMKEALVARGVPESAIYCDYAGFRTLDSVVRAQSIFGQSRFIIVSQHFHNERAIFLARRRGLDAVGFDAADVSRSMAPMTYLREYLARVQAVLDVTLLQTRPKFDGPPVMITQTAAP
jgi:SanA protein